MKIFKFVYMFSRSVPEIIDTVFAKTSPKRSFSMTEYERHGLVFTKTGTVVWLMVGSLKMNTTLEYSTRVVQEGDRRCKKSTLNDLAYLTPLRIPLMNPVSVSFKNEHTHNVIT
jgi:hypothetical protein